MSRIVTTDFGLVADGVTDNLAALNAAIAAYTAAQGKWTWPAGTYILSATPSVIPNGAVWEGEGATLTVIKGTRAAPSSTPVLTAASSQNVTLLDFHITTTDDANAAQQCLLVSGSSNLLCRGIKLSNGYSAGIRAASKTQTLRFFRGEVTNIHQDVSASGFTGDLSNSLIAGSWFHDNAVESSNTRHFIYLNGESNPVNTSVVNCLFQRWSGGECIGLKGDGTGAGSGIGAARNLSVKGCTFDQTGSNNECIGAQNTFGTVITDNNFFLTGQNGINMAGLNWDYTIDNNVGVSGPTETFATFIGVHFTGNGGGKITNNTYSKTPGFIDASTGIRIDGSNENGLYGRLEISGNRISGVHIGLLLTSPADSAVQGIRASGNIFGNTVGATDTTTGNKSAVRAFVGLTGGIVVDGAVRDIQLYDNEVRGMTYDTVFTTADVTTSSAGNADIVRFRRQPALGNYRPQKPALSYIGAALPTNVTVETVYEGETSPFEPSGPLYTANSF